MGELIVKLLDFHENFQLNSITFFHLNRASTYLRRPMEKPKADNRLSINMKLWMKSWEQRQMAEKYYSNNFITFSENCVSFYLWKFFKTKVFGRKWKLNFPNKTPEKKSAHRESLMFNEQYMSAWDEWNVFEELLPFRPFQRRDGIWEMKLNSFDIIKLLTMEHIAHGIWMELLNEMIKYIIF